MFAIGKSEYEMDELVERICQQSLGACPALPVPLVRAIEQVPCHFHVDQNCFVAPEVDKDILSTPLCFEEFLSRNFLSEEFEKILVLYIVRPGVLCLEVIVSPCIADGQSSKDLIETSDRCSYFWKFWHRLGQQFECSFDLFSGSISSGYFFQSFARLSVAIAE